MTGRIDSWCNMWADANVGWDMVSSSLLVSVWCSGVGRLAWLQVKNVKAGLPQRTSLISPGQAGKEGLKGSLNLEMLQDSFHCVLWLLLKGRKADVDWMLQHHWLSP